MIPTDRAVESIMKLFKLSQALHNTTYTHHSINTSQNIIQFSEQNWNQYRGHVNLLSDAWGRRYDSATCCSKIIFDILLQQIAESYRLAHVSLSKLRRPKSVNTKLCGACISQLYWLASMTAYWTLAGHSGPGFLDYIAVSAISGSQLPAYHYHWPPTTLAIQHTCPSTWLRIYLAWSSVRCWRCTCLLRQYSGCCFNSEC